MTSLNESDSIDNLLDGLHLVLIDDELPLLQTQTMLLRSLGIRVSAFENAEKGLEFIRSHHQEVDVVLSDERMSGPLQGHDLICLLKEQFPDIKLALMTGHAEDELLHSLGTYIIQKPIRLKQLKVEINQLLKK